MRALVEAERPRTIIEIPVPKSYFKQTLLPELKKFQSSVDEFLDAAAEKGDIRTVAESVGSEQPTQEQGETSAKLRIDLDEMQHGYYIVRTAHEHAIPLETLVIAGISRFLKKSDFEIRNAVDQVKNRRVLDRSAA